MGIIIKKIKKNMLDQVLTLVNHPFVEYKKEPDQYLMGEMATDLAWGITSLSWNFMTFITHILLMCVGLQKDDRTADEMPDYKDYDSTHHEKFMDSIEDEKWYGNKK